MSLTRRGCNGSSVCARALSCGFVVFRGSVPFSDQALTNTCANTPRYLIVRYCPSPTYVIAVRNQFPEAATFGPPTPTAAPIPTAELQGDEQRGTRQSESFEGETKRRMKPIVPYITPYDVTQLSLSCLFSVELCAEIRQPPIHELGALAHFSHDASHRVQDQGKVPLPTRFRKPL